MSNQSQFDSWYVTPLKAIEKDGDAGFIFAMVAFPLLERYLRGKHAVTGMKLTQACFNWLDANFPDIHSKGEDFWHAYRNGLLHQASFNTQKASGQNYVLIPSPYISGHDARPAYYDATNNMFFLNPVEFHGFVVSIIKSDFSSYEGSTLPLPRVQSPATAQAQTVATAGIYIQIPPTGVP